MKREDLDKLLGAYAAGTLTEAERTALFEAALDDQALFDLLAREQALKDTLDDPQHRSQVLAALNEPAASWRGWLRRPWPWAVAAATAASVVLTVGLVHWTQRQPAVEVARVKQTAAKQEAEAPRPAPPVEAETARPARKAKPEPAATLAARAREFAPPPVLDQPKKELPAPPEQVTAEARRANIAGGTPGGVVGGIISAPPAAAPPPPAAQSVAEEGRADFAASELRQRKAASASFAVPAAPPVRYTILRRGPDGNYAEAPEGTLFTPGDDLQLGLESRERLWTYVVTDRAMLFSGFVYPARQVRVAVPPHTGKLKIVTSRQELPAALRATPAEPGTSEPGVVEVTIRYR